MRKPIKLPRPVYLLSTASVAGWDEGRGPIGEEFDILGDEGDTFGCDTWEKSESEMQRLALSTAVSHAMMTDSDLDMIFAGDLLNQCVGSSYGLVSFKAPYLGLYGACSTAAEGMMLASLMCGAYAECAAAVTSSHNASAERQFRFPLEYGGQRTPTAQWTVTGAGAFIFTSSKARLDRVAKKGFTVQVTEVMPGVAVDAGVHDANNMGAAMAPAAADTVCTYLDSVQKMPELIVTGDLGSEGSHILYDLTRAKGHDISACHSDCGMIIYDRDGQDKHAGGSGCGCSAAVMSANILRAMRRGALKDVVFVGTGALMNSMSIQQGQSIPGIGHLVHFISVPDGEIGGN